MKVKSIWNSRTPTNSTLLWIFFICRPGWPYHHPPCLCNRQNSAYPHRVNLPTHIGQEKKLLQLVNENPEHTMQVTMNTLFNYLIYWLFFEKMCWVFYGHSSYLSLVHISLWHINYLLLRSYINMWLFLCGVVIIILRNCSAVCVARAQ